MAITITGFLVIVDIPILLAGLYRSPMVPVEGSFTRGGLPYEMDGDARRKF